MATKSDNIHDVHLIDATAPKYLFKYQRINDNSLNGLRKGRLWASLPSTFNDPFEFKYSQVGVNPLTDEVDYLLDQISSFKVVCFTLDPLNILMWSHYASNHEGMCLGFLNKVVTTPVTYTTKFPKVDFNINTDLEK